jgi:hypothetical protein
VLGNHRAKKAAKEHQEALARWQADRDWHAGLLKVARTFKGRTSSDLVLAPGETVFYKVTGSSLIEERRGAGHYESRSSGVSVPVGSLGGRSVRYRVGASHGHYVQGTPTPTAVDTGTVYITNKRVVFLRAKQTRECAFAKLIGVRRSDGDGSTTFSVSNRQKPMTVRYGSKLSGAFDFRLDLALAHFNGKVGDLVERLESELAQIDAQRPAAAVSA